MRRDVGCVLAVIGECDPIWEARADFHTNLPANLHGGRPVNFYSGLRYRLQTLHGKRGLQRICCDPCAAPADGDCRAISSGWCPRIVSQNDCLYSGVCVQTKLYRKKLTCIRSERLQTLTDGFSTTPYGRTGTAAPESGLPYPLPNHRFRQSTGAPGRSWVRSCPPGGLGRFGGWSVVPEC